MSSSPLLLAGLAAQLDAAVSLRHTLHAGAELSGFESVTAATVAAALGAPDAEAVAGTGRLVRIGRPDGPCIALRAELDALPVTEETGVPWASANGAMHACGHDVHLAALTAVGRAARLADATGDLPVPLLAVLQPREETIPSGARDIVASGALQAHQPAAIVAVHLQHQLPPGTVAAATGTVNAATDDFEIRVDGTGGHAGYPQLTADPVVALSHTVVSLQQIVSRRSDPTHAVVISIGMIEAGQANNVIPGVAIARGTLRVLDSADRPRLHELLREIVQHTCLAHGCSGTVAIDQGEPALVNDEDLTMATWPWLREAGFTVDKSLRSCGADDFSYFTGSAPALMMFLGTGGPFSLHHPSFLPADETVGQVAAALLAGYLGAQSLLTPPAPSLPAASLPAPPLPRSKPAEPARLARVSPG
ncbi:MAG TPA: M20 family metallopeptidase [Streptosporangiaceae bacterium]|nr:M20 family metallopeptidase [Streptosporangiaceae bacterium]